MPCMAAVSCGVRGGGAHCGGCTTEAAADTVDVLQRPVHRCGAEYDGGIARGELAGSISNSAI